MNNVQIYLHIREDNNEVFYVGIGVKKRPYSKKHRNTHWRNIANKTSFKIEIIGRNLSWKSAYKLEIALIKKYGRKDLGAGTLVNKTNGGEGTSGFSHSEDFKNSRIGSGNPMFGASYTKEQRDKIASKQMGSDNHFFGKTHTNETKKLLREKALEQFKDKSKIQNRKGVICTKTKKYFFTIKEASEFIGMSNESLRERLHGKIKNNTSLIFANYP